MLSYDGRRAFVGNKSSITCYNFNVNEEKWERYGSNFKRPAFKNGEVVKSNENVEIGFSINKGGNCVVAHEMGTYNINIFEINLKTLVWKKKQTFENIEGSLYENSSYCMDFLGNHCALYITDHGTHQGTVYYYTKNPTTLLYDLAITIPNASGVINSSTVRNIKMSKDGTKLVISDTNGNMHEPINDNGDGVIKIFKIDTSNYSYSVEAILSSNNTSSLFGASIGLNDTGTILLANEPLSFKFYIFEYNSLSETWILANENELSSISSNSSRFYSLVDLNAIGDAFFVGEYDETDNDLGIVYGYYKDLSGAWSQYQTLSGDFFDPTAESATPQFSTDFSFTNTSSFGSILSINSQGTTLLLGSNTPIDESNKALVIKDPKASTVTFTNLGLTPEEIVQLPLTPKELVQNSGLDISGLKQAGVSASTLLVGGKTENELFNSGFELADIVSASSDLSGLINDPSNNLKSKDLLTLDTVTNILKKGISTQQLLNDISGDITEVDFSQFKDAGINATDLKTSAGVDAKTLKNSAYEPSELVQAGFQITELKDAEIVAQDLKNAGVSFSALDGIYNAKELIDASFDDVDFLNAGYILNPEEILTVNAGSIAITQKVKTITKNPNINNVETAVPNSQEMQDFLKINPEATNSLFVNAYDSSGSGIYDVSNENVVVSFELPDLDPNEEHVLVKYDEDNFTLLNPQPIGYPAKLTYNTITGKYTASLSSLSMVSTSYASRAPDTASDAAQIYFASEKIINGGVTDSYYQRIYILVTYGKYIKNIKTSMFEITGGIISKVIDWNESSSTHKQKRYDIIKIVGDFLNDPNFKIPSNTNDTNTLKKYKLYQLEVKAYTRDASQNVIVKNKYNAINLKNGNIKAPVTTFSFTYFSELFPEIQDMYIISDEFYKYYPNTDSDTFEYYTNKTNIFTLYLVSNILFDGFVNDFITENCIVSNIRFSKLEFTHSIDIAGSIVGDEPSTTVRITIPPGCLKKGSSLNKNEYSFSYTIDTQPPELVISSIIANGSYYTNSSLLITFTCSEIIRELSIDNFEVYNAKLELLEKVDEITYTAYLVTLADKVETTATVQLKANTIMDLAGNLNVLPSNIFYVNFDTVRPTIQITSDDIENNQTINKPFIELTFTSSEIIQELTYDDISLSQGGILTRLSPSGEGNQYTARLTPDNILVNQTIEVFVLSGSIIDLNGNSNLEESAKFVWNYDVTKPTISVFSSATSSSTNDPFITYYIESSKEIKTITLSSFEVNEAAVLADLIEQPGKSPGFFYEVKLFPLSNLQTTFRVKSGGIIDTTNNSNEFDSETFYWTYDGIAPTISIISNDIDINGNHSENVINLIIKISDIGITLTENDLSLNRGTISNFVYDNINYQYTCKFTTDVPYENTTLFIPEGTLFDDAGNGNNRSNILSWKWDKSRPTITISSPDLSSGDYSNANELFLYLTPSEEIYGLTKDDVNILGGFITNLDLSNPLQITCVLKPDSGFDNLEISVQIPSGIFKDQFDYLNDQESNIFIWNYDTIIPEISIKSIDLGSSKFNNKTSINVEFNLNKIVNNFNSSQVTAINANLSQLTQLSDTIFSGVLSYTPESTPVKKYIELYVGAGSVNDFAGNTNTQSNILTWISDREEPKLVAEPIGYTGVDSGKTFYTSNTGFIYNKSQVNSHYIEFIFSKPIVDLALASFQLKNTVDQYGKFSEFEILNFVKVSDTVFRITIRPTNLKYDRFNNIASTRYAKGEIYLPPKSFKDVYGNVNTTETEPYIWIFDNNDPEISVYATTIPDIDGSYQVINTNDVINHSIIYLYIVSSKRLKSNVNTGRIYVTNAKIQNITNTKQNTEWRFELLPSGQGEIRIFVNSSFGVDIYKNRPSLKQSGPFIFNFDSIRPVLNITSPLFTGSSGYVTNQRDISLNLVFDEAPVNVTLDDFSYVNCSPINGSLNGSGLTYSFGVSANLDSGNNDIIVLLEDNNNILDQAGNSVNETRFVWKYNNETPKITILESPDVSAGTYTNLQRINVQFTLSTAVEFDFDKIIYSGCKVFSPFVPVNLDNTKYEGVINIDLEDYKGEITIFIPSATFNDFIGLNTPRYNNESYELSFNYFNHVPSIIISSNIPNNTTTNDSSLNIIIKDSKNEELFGLTESDIQISIDSNKNNSNFYIEPGSFQKNGKYYEATIVANEDSVVNIRIQPNSVQNKIGINNSELSQFTWTRDTKPVVFNLFSTSVTSGESSQDSSLDIFIQSNKVININHLKQNIQVINASINDTVDVGTDISGILFKTSLVPIRKNSQSSIKILSDSYQYIFDSYGNYNIQDSETFYWTFVGINPTVLLVSTTINNGVISSIQDISMTAQIEGDQVALEENDIQVINGTISNFTDIGDGSYNFIISANSETIGQQTSVSIPAGSFRDQFGIANIASPTFVYTFNDTRPFVTITCDEVINNTFSKFEEYTFRINFSTEVEGFTLSDISHIGGAFQGPLVYENLVYTGVYIPTITRGDLIIQIPENVCQDKITKTGNAGSTPFVISYDNEQPIVQIISDISSGLSTGDNEIILDLSFSKDIVNFDINKIYTTKNCQLIKIPNTTLSFYQIRILPLDSNYINVKILDNVFHDKFGNGNIGSSLFSWRSDNQGAFVRLTSSTFSGRDPALSPWRIATTSIFVEIEIFDDDDTIILNETDLVLENASLVSFARSAVNPLLYSLELTYNTPGQVSRIYVPEGVISDNAGNVNNASNAISWFYDNNLPSILVSSPDISDGTPSNASSITVYFDSSEELDIFSTSFLKLTNCVVIDDVISYLSTITVNGKTNYRYMGNLKFASGGVDSGTGIVRTEEIATIQVREGVIFDDVNFENSASNILIWNYDSIAPRFIIESTEILDSKYYENSSISMRLRIENDTSVNILSENFTTVNGTITNLVKQSNILYTFDFVSTVPNIDSSVYINEGEFADIAGNKNAKSNVYTWHYDSKPLTITTITANDGNKSFDTNGKTNRERIIIKVTFSEDILIFNRSYLSATDSTITSVTSDVNKKNIFNIEVYSTSKTPVISFNTTKIITTSKLTEKTITGTITSFTWNYDNTAPTMKIQSEQQLNNQLSNRDFINLKFIPSKTLVGFDKTSISISGDALISDLSYSDVGALYNAILTPTPGTAQTIIVSIQENDIFDTFGNSNSETVDFTWIYDNKPISVEISANSPSGSSSSLTPYIDLSFIFNESIKSFDLTNVDVSGGSLSIPDQSPDVSYIFTSRLKPSRPNQEAIVSIPAGRIVDIAGNSNTLDVSFSWTYSGTNVVPFLSSNVINNGEKYKINPIVVNINTGDSILQSLSVDDFNVTNGTITNIIQVDDSNWNFTFNSIQEGLLTSVFIINESLLDTNLNSNVESNVFSWTYDNTLPTINISSPSINSGDFTNTDFIFVSFNSSENITLLDTSINITNGSLIDFTGDGSSYNAKLIPDGSITNGVISLVVPPYSIQDVAGNLNDSSSNEFIWNYDTVEPYIIITSNDVSLNDSIDSSYVSLQITSNKSVTLTRNSFSLTDCVFISLSGSDANYTLVIATSDWSNNKNAKVKVKQNSVFDNAGNTNTSESNEYLFTINKEVIRKKEPDEILVVINDIEDIPDDEKPSQIQVEIALSTNFETIDSDGFTIINGVNNKTNSKVFQVLMDQMFQVDNNIKKNKIKVKKDVIPFKAKASEKLTTTNKESVVIAKVNQIISESDLFENKLNEAVYVPFSEINDFFEVQINTGEIIRIEKLSATLFNLSTNGFSDNFDSENDSKDTFEYKGYTFIFGSMLMTYDEPQTVVETPSDSTLTPLQQYIQLIPCFMKGTRVLTSNGYKPIETLRAGIDILLDDKGREVKCRAVERYFKKYDGVEFPYVVPAGASISKTYTCYEDLILTHNHGIYVPHLNKYVPSSRLNLRQDKTKVEYYEYYHIFTDNFFSDVIIANGIPCETHGRVVKEYIRSLDSSGKLMKKILEFCKAENDGTRNRIKYKDFRKICSKYSKNNTKYKNGNMKKGKYSN